MAQKRKAPASRVRRSAEEARALILLAAGRLFNRHGPDAVGLKEVAEEAGVSHGLVTHYFGTYEGLVESVLEERSEALRAELLERMATAHDEGPEAWIHRSFETVMAQEHGRLFAWALLSGRTERSDFFARRIKGLAIVADALEGWAQAHQRTISRDDLEVALLLTVATSIGYAVGRSVLWGALGREPSAERDQRVRDRFTGMLLAGLLPAETPPPPSRGRPRKG